MSENPIMMKSLAFALRVVKLCRYLSEEHREFTLSRELLSAGTNIGRHVKEAVSAESQEAFTRFMSMALRRADETEYWLQLIQFAELINEREYDSIEGDRKEIAKILTKIVKTSKNKGL
ncbi:MAG: four helix bundle protein [Pyrinomonadaceae bacterium]